MQPKETIGFSSEVVNSYDVFSGLASDVPG